MRKTFKYRLFTTRLQSDLLDVQLGEACRLYNAALQERRDAWKQRVSINYYTQANQLKEIRAAGDLGLANFSCCQDILRRVNKTYEAFFRRVKRGEKAGYPRFKSRRRFDSITFPSYGDGIRRNDNVLRIQGIGRVEVKLHRPVSGKIKTVTLKRECGNWYACFSVECEAKPLTPNTNEIGIDVGLQTFATMSDGKSVPNIALLQKIHQRIKNQRHEFQHKFTFWLVQNFGTIAVEDLNVKSLADGMLAKSVHDVSWAAFFSKLTYKAENAGRVWKAVNPRGTSQTCTCGAKVWKELSDREHVCTACGLLASRDVVSAQVILQRARMSPSNPNVADLIASVV